MDAQLNGSGDMELSGKATKDVEVKTTGSGNFEGKELISENARNLYFWFRRFNNNCKK